MRLFSGRTEGLGPEGMKGSGRLGFLQCLTDPSGTSGFLHEFYLKSELVFSLVYSVTPRVIGHKHEACHRCY